MDVSKVKGHSAMFGAELMWGVSAPIGKFILAGGIGSMLLTDCRMIGAAVLFWIISLFVPAEKIPPRDMLAMFFASLLGIVVNQCCFIAGLGLTSPVNASIITPSMPIVTMVLAALVLKEPVTKLKLGGVFLGAIGALVLIVGSHADTSAGSVAGDMLVIAAQCSFACYLVFFKSLISRYSAVTLMKWMFTYASVMVIPFTYTHWYETEWSAITPGVLWGLAFFVIGPTFLSYLLLPFGQRNLRPTVTAMYNYVQPIVATAVAIVMSMGRFTIANAVAVVLVFTGVFLVTKSKSRKDLESQAQAERA
ncbi:MAG: DMT family transporter [Muribaculaceae bacterium]|nr:DMT family transporter [Muribaculaceae bacterium]